MLNLKEHRPYVAQFLLTVLLLCLPTLYFIQKYEYIHEDFYTTEMSQISRQMDGKLERRMIWKNCKDEHNDGMIYSAYYYPQALSLVCHTTRVQNENTTPASTAYLVSHEGVLYPAKLVWNGAYNTTLLIFENIPDNAVDSLSYLDILPDETAIAASMEYDPKVSISSRVRYALQAM